jgi:hypothetical protein
LKDAISNIADKSEKISKEIRDTGDTFLRQSDAIYDNANRTIDTLIIWSIKCSIIPILLKRRKKSNGNLPQIPRCFRKTNFSAWECFRVAENLLKELKNKMGEAGMEEFLDEASFIFDKLHSLAVDIARIFQPDIEEDLWKRYYDGDRAAFMRHINKSLSKEHIGLIKVQYEEDSEFREYVNKYIAEFDSLIDKSGKIQKGKILTTIITGSDAGKLYMVLARALGV